MDVITRAEFDHSMKDVLTKTDFELRLADTKSELVSAMKQAVKENIDDLKVDLFAEIERKVTRSHNVLELGSVKATDLKDAKNEILATFRRNIADEIAPLKTDIEGVKSDVQQVKSEMQEVKSEMQEVKSEMQEVKSEVQHGFLKMGARLDAMEHNIRTVVMDGYISLDERLKGLTQEVRQTLKHHEQRLDRHDADLYKLRQSGVLQ